MAWSGPGGTWRVGPASWSALLPVERVRVYYVDGSFVDGWEGPASGVAGVVVGHPCGRYTWIANCDEYVSPDGRSLLGEQIGEVNGERWARFNVWMRAHWAGGE